MSGERTQHTPGPWLEGMSQDEDGGYYPDGSVYVVREYMQRTGPGPEDFEPAVDEVTVADGVRNPADRALITAAPDLLEALEALLAETEAAGNANANDYGWPTVVPAARAALAKARGTP